MGKLKRPALRYHGGKWRLAPWIISHFPAHVCYVEPFGGAASVLLRKAPSKFEIWNDLNGHVVNFFRVLRERPEDLVRAIELTPYARAEFALSRELDDLDPVERARRFCVWAHQGVSGAGTRDPGGWRCSLRQNGSLAGVWSNTGHLWQIARRFKRVMIECDAALAVIERFDSPGTLFYVDPPYVRSERWSLRTSATYEFEMWDEDHRALADVLNSVQGMVVLSGYLCGLYDELYEGWELVTRSSRTQKGEAREGLWLSPRTVEARGPLFSQIGRSANEQMGK